MCAVFERNLTEKSFKEDDEAGAVEDEQIHDVLSVVLEEMSYFTERDRPARHAH